jgi:hypothetical protein
VEFLVDLTGRSIKVGKRNVAVAVAKLGYIHIRLTDRTVIITLKPRLVHPLTVAAAGYEISDLEPERTIVLAGIENQECWIFTGYMSALRKMASFSSDVDQTGSSAEPLISLV